ncbi:hypothetical protein HX004_09570 [Myroides sp. 1354]|uniref:hypothetical protein n=1 Tax=unclassified Myroides TaxID=2642485 RepID=UPI0025788D8C|nr:MULTISPECIES: hypothetical protein [unclassified Myroides]MDM1045142.1 hypothetical protein [Myroides sp. R163-1]MDM1056024.1 hypothetical protein [Myroides sp. 1354]MDM1069027.1 hypothetical protein [Myroides sp. 1372]
MDKLVKGLVLLTTMGLVLNLFDFFSYGHADLVCYALLILSGVYFLIKKYRLRNEG